jgi:uncharacterized protein (TIGR00369 family)
MAYRPCVPCETYFKAEGIPLDENPFLNSLGVEIVSWSEGYAELSCTLKPEMLNRSGALQGGVVATLIDAACGYSGLYAPSNEPKRHGVTISLTVNYIGRLLRGNVRVIGRLKGAGRKVFFAYGEVLDETGAIVASGQTAHKLL